MIRRRAGRSDARALHGLFPLAKDIGGGKGTCRRIPESRTDIRERRRRSNFHHLLPPVRTCAAAATRRVFCGLDERYCSSNAAGMRAQAARGNRYVYRRRGESCHPGRPRLSNAPKSASRCPPSRLRETDGGGCADRAFPHPSRKVGSEGTLEVDYGGSEADTRRRREFYRRTGRHDV